MVPFVPSADNSNLSADGDESFVSVESAMPSPFSEVRISLGNDFINKFIIRYLYALENAYTVFHM